MLKHFHIGEVGLGGGVQFESFVVNWTSLSSLFPAGVSHSGAPGL